MKRRDVRATIDWDASGQRIVTTDVESFAALVAALDGDLRRAKHASEGGKARKSQIQTTAANLRNAVAALAREGKNVQQIAEHVVYEDAATRTNRKGCHVQTARKILKAL